VALDEGPTLRSFNQGVLHPLPPPKSSVSDNSASFAHRRLQSTNVGHHVETKCGCFHEGHASVRNRIEADLLVPAEAGRLSLKAAVKCSMVPSAVFHDAAAVLRCMPSIRIHPQRRSSAPPESPLRPLPKVWIIRQQEPSLASFCRSRFRRQLYYGDSSKLG